MFLRLFDNGRGNVPIDESDAHCRRFGLGAEHEPAVGGYMVDIAGRNDDTVVVVHPFLRAAQVGSRIQVLHFARRDTQRAHSNESDAVVGRMHAGGFTVILNDDGRFGLGIVEGGRLRRNN